MNFIIPSDYSGTGCIKGLSFKADYLAPNQIWGAETKAQGFKVSNSFVVPYSGEENPLSQVLVFLVRVL